MTDAGALEWVSVASFAREEEARLLAGRLEAEGIDARVYPEFQGSYYGERTVQLPVQVLVPAHQELEARAVTDRLDAS